MYDPFSEQSREDPYAAYATLRDQCPAYRNPEQSFWALSRHADVSAALRDWKTFSNAQGARRGGDLMDMDPPDHDRVRRLLAARFRPAAAGALEEIARASASEVLAQVAGTEFDFRQDFAQRLTALVMCRVLGLPETDTPAAAVLAAQLVFPGADAAAATNTRIRARSQLAELFLARVASGESDPESLIADLARAVDGGTIALSDVPGLCLMLVVAGLEPTTSLLTNIIHALATSQVATDQIRDAQGRVPSGVISEFLRYDAPVQWVSRVTTCAVAMHSHIIPAGHRVLLLLGSANRDPRRYEHPDEFNPRRDDHHSASFGLGVHACLGIPLARIQTRIALEVVLARGRTLQLAGPARRSTSHILRGFERLPIGFG
jgi:cytochrome P450